jgi:KaiC/GvpD/RAD55 family RecA-like ATPase
MLDFCCYLGASYLRAGMKVVFVETNMGLRHVRSQMAEFGAMAHKHEADGSLVMIDCYTPPDAVVHDEHELILSDRTSLDEILAKVNEAIYSVGGVSVRVLFDSMTPIFMSHEQDEVSDFFKDLVSMVKLNGVLTCTAHQDILNPEQISLLSSSADGILEMKTDEGFKRFVRIKRMKGVEVSSKWVPFDFARGDEKQGAFLSWKRS